jgi:hypothetical protein
VLLAGTVEEVQVEIARPSEQLKWLKAFDADVALINALSCAACRYCRRDPGGDAAAV